MTAPTYSTNLTAAQSTAANRWDSLLNVNILPSYTPVSDGHLWHFDTPPDTRRVEDVATKPMKFREGPTLAPLASLLNVDDRSQIALEQPHVTFSAPVWNSKREDSERLHSYYGTGIMSSVPSEFQLRPTVRSAEVVGNERLRNRYGEAQPPMQHVVLLASNSALQRTTDRKYRPIKKTLTFEDEDASTEHAPSSQPRWRHRYNTSPEMESDAEVKQSREHRTEETRQKHRSTTENRAVNTMRWHLDCEAQSDRTSSSGLSCSLKKVNQCIEDQPPRARAKQRRP